MIRGRGTYVLSLALSVGVLASTAFAVRAKPAARVIQSTTKKKIVMPIKPWVDVQFDSGNGKGNGDGDGSDLSGLLSAAKNGGNGNGNGNGKSAPVTSSPPSSSPKQIGMDDNQPKGQGNGNYGGGAGDNGGGGGSGAVAFPKWYPMCLFMGDHVSTSEGNAAVKGLVDQAAACKVNLVVFPITVAAGQIPNSADAVNQMQEASCNIQEGLGVPRSSTSTCAPYDRIAGEMCDVPDPKNPKGQKAPYDPAVAGCAVVAKAKMAQLESDLRSLFTADEIKNGDFATRWDQVKDELKNGRDSGTLPSIERTGACTAEIVGHEALGHSMWGHPNGSADGNGIGVEKQKNGAAEGTGSGGWTPKGCSYMYASAYDNDGRWRYDASRQQYYVKADPERVFTLGSDKVFRPPGPPPPDVPPRLVGGPPSKIGFDDATPKTADLPSSPRTIDPPSGKAGSPKGATVTNDEAHKAKPSQLLSSFTGQNTYKATPDTEMQQAINATPRMPTPGKGTPASKIGFDDEAPKGQIATKVSSAPQPPQPPRSPGAGGMGTMSTSEETTVYGSSSASLSSGGGGGKGSSIGYQDDAPKGGGSGSGSSISLSGRGLASTGGSGGRAPGEYAVGVDGGGGYGRIIGAPPGKGGVNPLDADFFRKPGDGEDDEENPDRPRRKKPGGALRLKGDATSDGTVRGVSSRARGEESVRRQGGAP